MTDVLIKTRPIGADSLSSAKNILEYGGKRRKVFDLLLKNHQSKRLTTAQELYALGGDVMRRVRELREGFTTPRLRAEGKMLWVDEAEHHDGKYWMKGVTWEQWLKLSNDARKKTIDAEDERRVA